MSKATNQKQTQKPFRAGDKIVDFGQVFKIFKIKERKSEKGGKEKVIFFKPLYQTDQNKDHVSSIPVTSIPLTRIRRPFPKSKLQEVLKNLGIKPKETTPVNTNKAKEELMQNKPEVTARVVKGLWRDNRDEATTFPSSKQILMKTAMRRLVEEMAYTFKTTPERAREKVEEALKKWSR